MGKITALMLLLNVNNPDEGLTQQEISKILDVSVSSISRQLNTLIEWAFCDFKEWKNTKGKKEKKYYFAIPLQHIVTKRLYSITKENQDFLERLATVKAQVHDDDNKNDRLLDIITNYEKILTQMNQIYLKFALECETTFKNV